jgi:hypothetical protein
MLLRKRGSSLSSSLSLPNFSLTFTTELRFSFVGSKLRNETPNPLETRSPLSPSFLVLYPERRLTRGISKTSTGFEDEISE